MAVSPEIVKSSQAFIRDIFYNYPITVITLEQFKRSCKTPIEKKGKNGQ